MSAEPPPFADLLAPLATSAIGRARMAPGACRLSEAAWVEAEWNLFDRLGTLAAPAVLSAFAPHRVLPPAARLLDRTPPSAPRDAWRAFVAQGPERALSAFPALLPRLRRVAEDWADAMRDFCAHLAQDDGRLPGVAAGASVVGVAFGLSDPHAGGRSVARVAFNDGGVLAYKPRSLAPERTFADILQALAGDRRAPDQRIPTVLDAGDHGWMEWISPAPCRDRAEAEMFYRRCGGLCAVLRAVRGGDIHADNLIPAGAFPVLVDLECLFQPAPEDLNTADPLLDPQVFQNGLLPVFTSFDGGATMVAVAGAGAGPPPVRSERRLTHVGTDWVCFTATAVPSFAAGPVMEGEALDVRDFADAFAGGYADALLALSGRPELLGRAGEASARFLAAPTNLYALILDAALEPVPLRSEAALDAALARAGRRPPMAWSEAAWARVTAAEHKALDRFDVPAFRFRPGATDVVSLEGETIKDVFGRAPLDRIHDDFAALSPQAVTAESGLLRAALRRPLGPVAAPPEVGVRAALRSLTDRIAELSVPVVDGRAWVRMWEQIPAPVAPAGPSLCYGSAGIAVALAEAAAALDDDALAGLAADALGPWRALVRNGRAGVLARRIGPGWGAGVGGLCAAFVWCADLLHDASLLDDAERLAEAAAPTLDEPGLPDVLQGAAGLALGAWVLAEQRPSAVAHGLLRAAGEVILARSRRVGEGRAWPDGARPGLPGLSHGASGIAAALAGVHAATGEVRWAEAAREALAYEASLFDPAERNWAAADAARPTTSTWCHGAPGVALARQRVEELAGPGDPMIPLALRTAAERVLPDSDDLCCGEAGRIEALETLGARRGAPEAQAASRAALEARLADWSRADMLTMSRLAGAPDDASLLRGLAGPAHVLARQLAPGRAVSVLMPFSRRPGR